MVLMSQPQADRALWVDERWSGDHGIGRYASEVLRRVTLPRSTLSLEGSPTQWRTVISRGWRSPHVSDLIYTPGFVAGATRTPQIVTLHDLIHIHPAGPFYKSVPRGAYFERFLKAAIRRAGVVVTVSETSRRQIETWLNDDAVRVVDAGNGRSEAFSLDGPVYQSPVPYLLMVGNARPHKNSLLGLQAMSLMPDFRGVIVTMDRRPFEAMISKMGLGHRITVLSNISDAELAAIYRGASALLFPSRIEGFGLPALESGACGTPTAYLPECEAVGEIVKNDRFAGGDFDDVQGFVDAVASAVAAKPGYHMVDLESYSWDAVATKIERVLAELLQSSRK